VPFFDLETNTRNLETIHLLKCDIEGSEELFIKSYDQSDLFRKTQAAVFEFHPKLCNTSVCKKLLKDNQFNGHQRLKEYIDSSIEYFWKE